MRSYPAMGKSAHVSPPRLMRGPAPIDGTVSVSFATRASSGVRASAGVTAEPTPMNRALLIGLPDILGIIDVVFGTYGD